MILLALGMVGRCKDLRLAAAGGHTEQACCLVVRREHNCVVRPPACPSRSAHDRAKRDRRPTTARHFSEFPASEKADPSTIGRDERRNANGASQRSRLDLIDRSNRQLVAARVDDVPAIRRDVEIAIETGETDWLRSRRDDGEAHRLWLGLWGWPRERPRGERSDCCTSHERRGRRYQDAPSRHWCWLCDAVG
jgi:hypothetical protein